MRRDATHDVARDAKPIEVAGLAKPFAARIMALATGGQTLLTDAEQRVLCDDLPAGTEIRSHGHYRLKGVEDPVEVLELGVCGDSAFTPPQDVDTVHRVVRVDDL